jgi:hypothetical protein
LLRVALDELAREHGAMSAEEAAALVAAARSGARSSTAGADERAICDAND